PTMRVFVSPSYPASPVAPLPASARNPRSAVALTPRLFPFPLRVPDDWNGGRATDASVRHPPSPRSVATAVSLGDNSLRPLRPPFSALLRRSPPSASMSTTPVPSRSFAMSPSLILLCWRKEVIFQGDISIWVLGGH